ncbi:10541_t:CDS:10 [Acaulospora morrowiae]|uniref:10541_t:CDS:1 n=1 Tax=Acaulospora morrowiae TaxID=94023 RepID=A0A9N8YWQ5_9GLOM|nr:10541_t:CDS:10 [Acaulospora morrowiae]
MKGKCVRIGCYGAFWGDSVSAAYQLVKEEGPKLDYLVADYLAEVTMGLLARRRNPRLSKERKDLGGAGEGGYVAEFITLVLQGLLQDIVKHNIKIVTNAGGLDPLACKLAIEKIIKEKNIEEGKIVVAAITGDDIMNQRNVEKDNFREFSHIHGNKEDAESYPDDKKEIISLNAYLGAVPIAQALNTGATIVVTGRCVDSALVLGPLIYEFGWNPYSDWDRLASGSLAGHILECGCQATGGNFTDWEQIVFTPNGGWSNMGYPIAECFPDGNFVVTKPKETGGLVTPATVGEQMLYEIMDPGSYILPDVILDMRNVKLKQLSENKVLVMGVKGRPPTKFLKVSGIYADGYKMTRSLVIGGIDARKKAAAVGSAIILRVRSLLRRLEMADFRDVNVEILGAEHTYGPHARTRDTREVVLNITVHHDDARALKHFSMELSPAATCMAPGITGGGMGRPRPSPLLVHFSCLVPKGNVPSVVTVGKNHSLTIPFNIPNHDESEIPPPLPQIRYNKGDEENVGNDTLIKVPLIRLAWGRSGDKGDTCNIGIIAREPKYLPYIKRTLTEETVKEYMSHLCKGMVKRYEVPGINGLNFVLTRCLGGGGLSSLHIDGQGKTYAQMLLNIKIGIPPEWFAKL